jgi:hypothetical protein
MAPITTRGVMDSRSFKKIVERKRVITGLALISGSTMTIFPNLRA